MKLKLIQDLIDDVVVIVERHIAQNFRDESFDGKPWAPRKTLNASDKKNKRLRALLVDSGIGKRGIEVRAKGLEIEVTSDMDYMPYHQNGDKPQPKRQFVGETSRLKTDIEQAVEDNLRLEFEDILRKYRKK